MTSSILQISAAVLGTIGAAAVSYYLGKWIGAWRRHQQVGEVATVRKDSVAQNQKDNAESDALKKIDGR